MNIAADRIKQNLAGKSVTFTMGWDGVPKDFQGEVVEARDHYAIIDFWVEGNRRQVQVPNHLIHKSEDTVGNWWRNFVGSCPSERVLGDRRDIEEIAPLKIDAIGRGKKGFGHGSIDMKPVRRKRKNGHVWEKSQPWYQWEDESGKHCRYLRKGVDLTVQRLIDEGATVEMVLESIGKSKDSSKGKTR
ncbi:MAG: hypothetical protein H7237_08810 [Alkalinema sp. FL-bin-369]|nr:hypothetical protein [Leptolyngbyaceae cyanobacterium LF-bin-369]